MGGSSTPKDDDGEDREESGKKQRRWASPFTLMLVIAGIVECVAAYFLLRMSEQHKDFKSEDLDGAHPEAMHHKPKLSFNELPEDQKKRVAQVVQEKSEFLAKAKQMQPMHAEHQKFFDKAEAFPGMPFKHVGGPHHGFPHGGPFGGFPHFHGGPHGGPPHDGPPGDGPPHEGPPHGGPPHDWPPHDGPHHGGPPHGGPPHDWPPHDGHGGPHADGHKGFGFGPGGPKGMEHVMRRMEEDAKKGHADREKVMAELKEKHEKGMLGHGSHGEHAPHDAHDGNPFHGMHQPFHHKDDKMTHGAAHHGASTSHHPSKNGESMQAMRPPHAAGAHEDVAALAAQKQQALQQADAATEAASASASSDSGASHEAASASSDSGASHEAAAAVAAAAGD